MLWFCCITDHDSFMFTYVLNRMSWNVDGRELGALYLRAQLLTFSGFKNVISASFNDSLTWPNSSFQQTTNFKNRRWNLHLCRLGIHSMLKQCIYMFCYGVHWPTNLMCFHSRLYSKFQMICSYRVWTRCIYKLNQCAFSRSCRNE